MLPESAPAVSHRTPFARAASLHAAARCGGDRRAGGSSRPPPPPLLFAETDYRFRHRPPFARLDRRHRRQLAAELPRSPVGEGDRPSPRGRSRGRPTPSAPPRSALSPMSGDVCGATAARAGPAPRAPSPPRAVVASDPSPPRRPSCLGTSAARTARGAGQPRSLQESLPPGAAAAEDRNRRAVAMQRGRHRSTPLASGHRDGASPAQGARRWGSRPAVGGPRRPIRARSLFRRPRALRLLRGGASSAGLSRRYGASQNESQRKTVDDARFGASNRAWPRRVRCAAIARAPGAGRSAPGVGPSPAASLPPPPPVPPRLGRPRRARRGRRSARARRGGGGIAGRGSNAETSRSAALRPQGRAVRSL